MKFSVYHRPFNIGGCWKLFKIVDAENNAQACDIACGEKWSLGILSKTAWNKYADGTKEKPFIGNGGASEIMAEETK